MKRLCFLGTDYVIMIRERSVYEEAFIPLFYTCGSFAMLTRFRGKPCSRKRKMRKIGLLLVYSHGYYQ